VTHIEIPSAGVLEDVKGVEFDDAFGGLVKMKLQPKACKLAVVEKDDPLTLSLGLLVA